jgi:Domain of unknown function (DUF397)
MDWRKSTHSGGNGGDCIEVATADAVLVRDSKDRDGQVLAFTSATWTRFLAILSRLGSNTISPRKTIRPSDRPPKGKWSAAAVTGPQASTRHSWAGARTGALPGFLGVT